MKKQVVVLLSMALAISTLGNKAVVFANDVAVTDTKITTEKSENKPYLFNQETENNNISFDFKDGVLTVSGESIVGK